jgi:iron complex outermembrane receptor protein
MSWGVRPQLSRCLLIFAALGSVREGVAQTAAGTVFGEVRDSRNRPLARAQVYVVGARNGTISDTAGKYVLSDVPCGLAILEATSVGYAARRDSVRLCPQRQVQFDFVLWPPLTLYDPVVIDSVCDPNGRCLKY